MSGSYGDAEFKTFPLGNGDNGAAISSSALEVATGNITNAVWTFIEPMIIRRLGVFVTVAFDYNVQTVEGVVSFFRRITYGSDTGRVLVGTVRLIHGTALGSVLYKNVDDVEINPGEQLVAAVTVAATGGGGIAGDFLPCFAYDYAPEQVVNLPKMVAA